MIKLARKILCLDWDKRALRLVVARVGPGEMELDDAHAHRIPGTVDPEDPQAMGAWIAQTLQRHRIKQNRVIVDVPRDRAVINRLTIPPTPASELAAAVRFQAMRELPFPLEEARIDHVVTQKNEEGLATEVLLAAVRLEALNRVQETCGAAGLTPARIGLRPYANMVSVMHLPAMQDRRVLFVDVGPTMTEIDVMHGGALAFSRAANVSVPFHGGDLVTDDSRVSSKAELSELEFAESAESAAVDELLVEITRTLQAYRATDAGAAIEQIVIAGGTGVEHSLVEAADERFDLPATLFDPTVSLGVDEREAVKLRAFAPTLGLAWGLSKEGLLELDFLNPKKPVPPQQSLRRRMRIVGIAAAVVVLGVGGAVVADLVGQRRELKALQEESRVLREQVLENVEIDIKCLEAQEWKAEARATVWLDHLLWLTQQTIDAGKKMLVSEVRFNTKGRKREITLELECSDWEIPDEFVTRLNELTTGSGKPLYRASHLGWDETSGKVTVEVELLELSERKPDNEREADYRKLRKVG